MSRLAMLWGLYPLLLQGSALGCIMWLVLARQPWALVGLLLLLYAVPPLTFRMHERLWPLEHGGAKLVGKRYVPWWGGYQIQLLYLTWPQLEALLRSIPGVYSAWLRLWGARVGKGVVWTPQVEITDRSLLEIGDDVVLGHQVKIFGHIIRPTRQGNLLLFVRPVQIGAGAFIGAGSALGPGVRVRPAGNLPAQTVVPVAAEVG
jgi:hypothetical protein